MRVWWTPDDLKKSNERTGCKAKEYDAFEVAPGQKLNGHLTLGENTADNGGIRIAFQALEETLAKEGPAAEPGYTAGKRDGYTPQQRFFIAFARSGARTPPGRAPACSPRPTRTAPASGASSTVQSFDEFGKAFGCKVGQPMMPRNSCRVW